MRFKHRRSDELEEGESYYVSMTDMMVGVLFIFIIMLSYFALNFRTTTAALTSAKDAQTAVLLPMATALERKDVSLEIDHKAHIVCIPGAVLADSDVSDDSRHCFAFSGSSTSQTNPQNSAAQLAAADQAALMTSVGTAMDKASIPVTTSIDNGTLSFTADQLFVKGGAQLTPEGQQIAQKVAATLAQELPCFAYGVPPQGTCQNDSKMAVVNVTSSINFNAFTETGRAVQALALERSVAFHDALIAAQPSLGQLRTSEAQTGAQGLLQVASYGQSNTSAGSAGAGETISIQFHMAQ